MGLLFQYRKMRLRTPAISLGGRLTRPKPLIEISLGGPSDTRLVQALLDTGADDTVFPERYAALIGIDLTNAPEAEASGIGGLAVVHLRFPQVTLRLATAREQRKWPAIVPFTAAPFRFPRLDF